MLERIQKIISAAGVTSRRAAEQLIIEGRVRVNGKVVTELGTKADAENDHIKVDGKLINPSQPKIYLMLNKPAGYVTTLSDPEKRQTVQDLLKGVKTRVYPVGRLDYHTEGLLLLTNDGDFAHRIMHPLHGFSKTYQAKIKGVLDDKTIAILEKGVYLEDGRTAPAEIRKIRKEVANSWIEIIIREGKKRQVRRMLERVGHSVVKLKRTKIGFVPLGDLPLGAYRHLTREEIEALSSLSTGRQPSKPTRAGKPGPRTGKPSSRAGKPGLRTGKPSTLSTSRQPSRPTRAGKPDPRAGKPSSLSTSRQPFKPTRAGKPSSRTGKPSTLSTSRQPFKPTRAGKPGPRAGSAGGKKGKGRR